MQSAQLIQFSLRERRRQRPACPRRVDTPSTQGASSCNFGAIIRPAGRNGHRGRGLPRVTYGQAYSGGLGGRGSGSAWPTSAAGDRAAICGGPPGPNGPGRLHRIGKSEDHTRDRGCNKPGVSAVRRAHRCALLAVQDRGILWPRVPSVRLAAAPRRVRRGARRVSAARAPAAGWSRRRGGGRIFAALIAPETRARLREAARWPSRRSTSSPSRRRA